MTTVVFVHGINVRHADFQQTCCVVTFQMGRYLPGSELLPCEWGDDFGANLHCQGRSIPTYDTTKDAVSVLPEIETATLWETLYQDPLFEVRLLGNVQANHDAIPPPFALAAADDWLDLLDEVERSVPVIDRATTTALLPYLHSSVAMLRSSDELADALKRFEESSAELPSVAARAITAEMMRMAAAAYRPTIQGADRDALVIAIEDVLGGTAKGVISWVTKPLLGLAKNLSNRYVRRNRRSLSDLAGPIIGDLIVYQGRGAPIRARFAEILTRATEPVIVIAHSLGGVAVVDTLLLEPHLRSRVRHLVTVGSQAGFFYEINGLIGMPYAEHASLPSDFPSWLNFYDKADMLSYLVAPVLGDKATDVEVSSDQPFPQSHSAYWTSAPLWQDIASAVGR